MPKVSQELIDDRVDVNGHCGIEVTALQLSAHRGYLPLILPLLKSGSHVNAEGKIHGSAL